MLTKELVWRRPVRCETEVLVLAELVREGWDGRMSIPPLPRATGSPGKNRACAGCGASPAVSANLECPRRESNSHGVAPGGF